MITDLLHNVDDLINEGKMEEALDLLEENTSVIADIKRSIIKEKQGKYEEALHYAVQALQTSDPILHIHAIVCRTYALWRLDRIEEAHEHINQGLTLVEQALPKDANEEKLLQFKAEFLYLKAILYNTRGELNRPFELFRESYEIRKQIHHSTVSHSLNAMGVIKELMGELIEALKYHEEALELKHKEGNIQDIYRSMYNIGMLYLKTGNFKKSLACFNEGLLLAKKAGFEKEQIMLRTNIAMLEDKLGHLERAEEIYTALVEVIRQKNDPSWLAAIYQDIIHFYRRQGDFRRVEAYMDEFRLLVREENNHEIDMLLKIEEALGYANSSRFYLKMQGQRYLREILDELLTIPDTDVSDIIQIYVYLIRGLLDELAIAYHEDIIVEIHEFIQEIEHRGRQENLILTQIEAREFLAKLKLLEGDTHEAQNILVEAQQIAETKGFSLRAKHISEEYDRIIIQGALQDDEIPLKKRLHDLRMDDVLSRMILEKAQPDYVISDELPIQVLITNDAGNSIFSRSFESELHLPKELIGSFLSAINAFGNELFSKLDDKEQGTVNRIEHQGYSILLKTIG